MVASPAEKSLMALARRLRALRKARGLTLAQVSEATDVAASTLSKIENGLLSPTYDNLLKIAAGLGLDVGELFTQAPDPMGAGRRALSRLGEGQRHETPHYDHLLLCTALSHKRMMPFLTTIKARTADAAGEWSRHEGEEFVYVLSGDIELHTEFYQAVRLTAGESFYLDSRMGHRVITVSADPAQVLWMSTQPNLYDPATPSTARRPG